MMNSLIAIFQLVAAVTAFDNIMTADEKRKTGINKLNEQEKTALQEWIDTKYRAQPKETTNQTLITLQENLMNGQYIKLSDQTLWHIRPEDYSIVQGWVTSVELVISPGTDPFFPIKLTNKVTGSSVFARKIDQLPKETSPAIAPKAEEKILSPKSSSPQKTQTSPTPQQK